MTMRINRDDEEENKQTDKEFIDEFKDRSGKAPIGKYPDGKLTDNDMGALEMKIGILERNVVMDFGTPVQSIGMPPDECVRFANLLIAKAEQIRLNIQEDESNH